MPTIKLNYQNKSINVTASSFGKLMAKTMKDIASSHVFFVMQQAYGDIDYSECEKIWNAILNPK